MVDPPIRSILKWRVVLPLRFVLTTIGALIQLPCEAGAIGELG
jgi:hypothetical protein